MPSHTFGYIRVSTEKQTLDQQLDALVAIGVQEEHIYSDKMSGVKADRPGLARLLEVAREGDSIHVVALDRLGRSLSHVLETIEDLDRRGIVLHSIREAIDFSTPTGRMIASMFGAMAEYERSLMLERAAAARAAALARGKQPGRPRALSPEQVKLAQRMHASGESVVTISRTLGVSRATIYRSFEPSVAR